MRILVTGAAGRVGQTAARHLIEQRHEVVATDAVYRADLPYPLKLADLREPGAIYPLAEGCDAVVHLGNHPNPYAVRPSQTLLADNTAMNVNTFTAAIEVGIRRIVFASTIQVIKDLPAERSSAERNTVCRMPYLPLDSLIPARPGYNVYAMSKMFGEQMLEVMSRQYTDLAAVVLRLPFIIPKITHAHWNPLAALRENDQRLAEALCHLPMREIGSLFSASVERSKPGYRCYFPARSFALPSLTPAHIAERYLPHMPIRGKLDGPGGLVDLSALQEDLGWAPTGPALSLEP